jgi:hypothetical protein
VVPGARVPVLGPERASGVLGPAIAALSQAIAALSQAIAALSQAIAALSQAIAAVSYEPRMTCATGPRHATITA